MGRHVAVGNAARYPDDALARVDTCGVGLAALADQLHDPCLPGIGDRERFAARGVAVGVGQLDDHSDRLAGGFGALQRDVDERAVIHQSGRVGQLLAAAEGRLGDDERMFVHVADGRIALACLRNVREVTSRVPFVDGQDRSLGVFAACRVVEGAVERVGVGRIGDHHRSVGRGSFRDDEVGACGRRSVGEHRRRRENRSDIFHRTCVFCLRKDRKLFRNGKKSVYLSRMRRIRIPALPPPVAGVCIYNQ